MSVHASFEQQVTRPGRGGLRLPEVELHEGYGPKEFLRFFHGLWVANTDLRFSTDYAAFNTRSVEPRQLVVPTSESKPLVVLDYSCRPRQQHYDSATERMRVLLPPSSEAGQFQVQTDVVYKPKAEGSLITRDAVYLTHKGVEEEGFRVLDEPDSHFEYQPGEVAAWAAFRVATADLVELLS